MFTRVLRYHHRLETLKSGALTRLKSRRPRVPSGPDREDNRRVRWGKLNRLFFSNKINKHATTRHLGALHSKTKNMSHQFITAWGHWTVPWHRSLPNHSPRTRLPPPAAASWEDAIGENMWHPSHQNHWRSCTTVSLAWKIHCSSENRRRQECVQKKKSQFANKPALCVVAPALLAEV